MIISKITLKNFRNFKAATINVNEKTLIIGSNDVGKTNLLHALRIVLDRSLSDQDIEPKDSDFYCHEDVNELSILIEFTGVTEDCVLSKLKEKVSDKGIAYIKYEAWKDTRQYKFFAGPSTKLLEEIQERYYRKVVHLKYISSNRDLFSYVRRERRNLLNDSKLRREPESAASDDKKLKKIEKSLLEADKTVSELSYIMDATAVINSELQELSFHHEQHDVVFDVGASDVSAFVDNLHLSSRVNNRNVAIGGDGRNNQIFLALWAARNEIQEENPLEVTFYCIEEPEAHLHPHQQRKLSQYLVDTLKGQVFITSHSPQIAAEFSPNSIVRLLWHKKAGTKAASDGCSEIIEESVVKFGHRLDVLSAEAFFANVVFLVEGMSEILFYKALSEKHNIDLNRLNISILMADGIGFDSFIKVLTALEIKWCLRTDNDVFKIPRKKPSQFRMAGVLRATKIYSENIPVKKSIAKVIRDLKPQFSGFQTPTPPEPTRKAVAQLSPILEESNVFLSDIDLENDMMDQGLEDDILEFLGFDNRTDALNQMQKGKATFMFSFLQEDVEVLKKLDDSKLLKPLLACKKLASE